MFLRRSLCDKLGCLQSLTQQSSAIEAADSRGAARARAQPATVLALLTLAALWLILCRQLSSEWSVNEQYNYGWFVPFFAAYLFWLRWEDRPRAEKNAEKLKLENAERIPQSAIRNPKSEILAIAITVISLLLLAPLRLFEIGNPDWRPLNWAHTAAVVALTFVGIGCAGRKAWVRHFAFPIAFIFVAVPWISAIEQPVVQGLMRIVAVVAAEITNLCGIPAEVEGNLIRLNSGLVGVNEACSGVRSIQTSLMIGLLFGELRRLTVVRRIGLVSIALAVAIVGNFARAFSLVWVSATREKEAFTSWHDIAGYSIVAVVFVACVAAASALAPEHKRDQKSEDSDQKAGDSSQKSENRGQKTEDGSQNTGDSSRKAETQRAPVGSATSDLRPPTSDLRPLISASRASSFHLPTSYFLLSLAWLLVVEAGAEIWYRSHESNMVPRLAWSVQWPKTAEGFREIPIDEEIKTTLRFDEGREASWLLPGENGSASAVTGRFSRTARCLLFFFRWEPGTSTILRARAHRPDICLPSAGWRQVGDQGTRLYRAAANLELPFRHFTFDRSLPGQRRAFAHAFFCIHEDRVRASENTPTFDPSVETTSRWASSDRWRVVRQGRRNPGQQVMEFILINDGDEAQIEKADAQFAALLPSLVSVRQ